MDNQVQRTTSQANIYATKILNLAQTKTLKLRKITYKNMLNYYHKIPTLDIAWDKIPE